MQALADRGATATKPQATFNLLAFPQVGRFAQRRKPRILSRDLQCWKRLCARPTSDSRRSRRVASNSLRLFSRLVSFSAFGPGHTLNTGSAAADRAPLFTLLVAFIFFFSNGARFDVFSRRGTGCSASLLRKGRRDKGEAEGDERADYKALHGVFSILGSVGGTAVAQREPTRRQSAKRDSETTHSKLFSGSDGSLQKFLQTV